MTKVPVEIARWQVGRVLASRRDAGVGGIVTGGVASLNHRLIAWNPPGSGRETSHVALRRTGRMTHFQGWLPPDAEGIPAISRWSRSGATIPPVCVRQTIRIPEGCQRLRGPIQIPIFALLDPPPHHAEGILAISRWLRSKATTPPVYRVQATRIPEGCKPGRALRKRFSATFLTP